MTPQRPDALFVLSLPRSGSTFAVDALGSHPDVAMTCHGSWVPWLRRATLLAATPVGETIDDGEGFVAEGFVSPEYAPALEAAAVQAAEAATAELMRVLGVEGASWFGDKILSPADLDFALARWPEARVIHLIRDPRDVLVSSLAADAQGFGFGWDGIPWEDRASWAVSWVERAARVLEERDVAIPVLRYEDFVTRPEETLGRVFDSLDLSFHPDVQEYLDTAASERFAAHGTSADPLASIGRWRSEIPSDMVAPVEEALAPILHSWDYPRST